MSEIVDEDDAETPDDDGEGSALSSKRKRFVEEYLVDSNATQAAIRAGYSPVSARAQASHLLTKPNVQAAIEAGKARISRRCELSAERVLRELALVAFADIGDVIRVGEDGKVFVKNLDSIEPEARRAIGEITQVTTESSQDDGRVVEKIRLGVKQHSKVAALKMLVDHLGLNAPVKQEVSVEVHSAKQSLETKLESLRGRIALPKQSG